MVEAMLKAVPEFATLGCKWKVFKKGIFSCTIKCFSVKHEHCHGTNKCHPRKKWFLKECHGAQKYLMTLDVVKDKENHQKHLHAYNRFI